MKMKKILALVLALMMVASLTACGSSGGSKAEEKPPVAYQNVLTAIEDWVGDMGDLEAMCNYLGGDFMGKELYDLVQFEVENELVDADDFSAAFKDELDIESGTELKISVKDETKLSDEDLADYQERLDDATEGIGALTDALADAQDQMDELLGDLDEEQMAAVREQFEEEMGMSLDDWLKLIVDMHDKLAALAEKLDGATIEKGLTSKLTYKIDGEKQFEDIVFLKINGEWAPEYLIDMLDSLQSEANSALSDAA